VFDLPKWQTDVSGKALKVSSCAGLKLLGGYCVISKEKLKTSVNL
jgi:hypothetical protein